MPLTLLLVMVVVMTTQPVRPMSASQPKVIVGQKTVYGTAAQVGEVTVSQFLGLRFAHPPVGPSRFSKPSPAPLSAAADGYGDGNGDGGGDEASTVNATIFPKTCPGILLMQILPTDEDCLFLNIYVPQRRSNSRPQGGDSGEGMSELPVMVWLYGGAFVFGSGSQYDGGLLAAEGNVIVVTLNYRVGPLGFLSTGDNSSVGNYGLWDQWLALKWVQNNIGHFGGDVNRVTLFGESAGAASVSYHMTSPHSQGLFHRAILQSGSRLNPWAMDEEAVSHAKLMGRLSSCDTGSTSALVSCLRGQPWQSLRPRPLLTQTWGPVVDGDFVLPFDPSSSVPFQGPVMIGTNNREGGMLLRIYRQSNAGVIDRRANVANVGRTLRRLFPSLAASASPENVTLAARTVDCVYRGEGSTDTDVTDEELEEFVGDVEIVLGCQQFLDSVPSAAGRGVYQYYFDHYPDNIQDGQKGMDHAMELNYIFGFHRGLRGPLSPFYNRTVSHRDQLLARRFRTLLTNFAHSGNPNQPSQIPNATGAEEWPKWPPYSKGDQSHYLSLTSSPRVASRLKGERMRVWKVTVPAVLRGEGPVGLNLTPWSQCSNPAASSSSSSPSLRAVVPLGSPASGMLLLLGLFVCRGLG